MLVKFALERTSYGLLAPSPSMPISVRITISSVETPWAGEKSSVEKAGISLSIGLGLSLTLADQMRVSPRAVQTTIETTIEAPWASEKSSIKKAGIGLSIGLSSWFSIAETNEE